MASERVTKLVRERLGLARDNYHRARSAFRGKDLSEQHGESGKTRGDVLRGYEDDVQDWERELRALEG